MTDDWFDDPEMQAAALEGWTSNPVAQVYEATLRTEPGLTTEEFLARCTPASVVVVRGPADGHVFNYDDVRTRAPQQQHCWWQCETNPCSHGRFQRLASEGDDMSQSTPRDKAILSIMMTQEVVEDAAIDVSRREMLKMIQKVDAALVGGGRRRVGLGTFRITFEVETEDVGESDA